ncbi:hypothetical protein BJY52DRAFT_1268404 [Lactarius psammicola]|nr:hypothetical protein BJY52DRAFT_1268404 [Lactarius psammicola]
MMINRMSSSTTMATVAMATIATLMPMLAQAVSPMTTTAMAAIATMGMGSIHPYDTALPRQYDPDTALISKFFDLDQT